MTTGEDPRFFKCICCEQYHWVGHRQPNGFCKQCDDEYRDWINSRWVPSWSLIFFLGIIDLVISWINKGS